MCPSKYVLLVLLLHLTSMWVAGGGGGEGCTNRQEIIDFGGTKGAFIIYQ